MRESDVKTVVVGADHWSMSGGVVERLVAVDQLRDGGYVLEMLEPRLLLSSTSGTHPVLTSPVIHSDWFAELAPSTVQPVGGPATLSYDEYIETIEWEGHEVDVVTRQWVVLLTEQAIQQVGSITNVQSMLNLSSLGGRVIQGLGMQGLVLVETDVGVDQSTFVSALKANDLVAAIEPNIVIQARLTPSDSRYSQLWALHNTGQTGGKVDADIDAPEAWGITTGSQQVVVAVIDTGVDYNHPDLRANMWVNLGEIPGDGIDNDGNGFVDDVYGYDFVNNDGSPLDDNGHGTHVAGTIGAVGNNDEGVTGVAWSVSIMAVKFLNANGSGFVSNAIKAINYVTMMKTQFGVNVVVANNSWGGGGYNSQMFNAILAAQEANILFVAAAGNDKSDNDVRGAYPANYELDNVISVAATDYNDELAGFSNWGASRVHLAAPGVVIRSTIPGGGYGAYSGTSMAAPHVSGVAALLWSLNPNLSYREVKDAILNGVDKVDALANKVATGGRLNAYNALMQIYNGPSPDQYEANDSRTDVDSMTPGAPGSANLGTLNGTRTIGSLNTYDGSEDWFRFEMTGTGRVGDRVSISLDSSRGRLDLAVYREDGSLVGQSTGASDLHTVSLAGEEAGVYYVRITPHNGAENTYSLTIAPGLDLGDDYESNNSRTEVDSSPEGAPNSPNLGLIDGKLTIDNLNTLDGTEDWFSFRIQGKAGKKHKVAINFIHAQGDLDLILYDATGAIIRRSEGIRNTEQVSLKGLTSGTYYVRVYGYQGAGNPNYSLSITTPVPAPDKAGNTIEEAMQVKRLNKPINEYVGVGDEVDYYRVELKKPYNNLMVNVKQVAGTASVQLVSATGQVLSQGMVAANNVAKLNMKTPLPAGVYYIVVEAEPGQYVDYNLKMNAKPISAKKWNNQFAAMSPVSTDPDALSSLATAAYAMEAAAAKASTLPVTLSITAPRLTLVNTVGSVLQHSLFSSGDDDSDILTGERVLAEV